MLALAVCTIENSIPVAVAPSLLLQNRNDLRATANGFTARSAIYPKFRINRIIPKNILSPTFRVFSQLRLFFYVKLGIIFYLIPKSLAISSSSSHSGSILTSFSFSIISLNCFIDGLAYIFVVSILE